MSLSTLPKQDFSPVATPSRDPRPLRIALAGYGVVGQALAARLAGEGGFEIASILVRDVTRTRAVPPPCPLTDDRQAFLASRFDVLVDVLSCERTGTALCAHALPRGIDAVSASKRVIAQGYRSLADAAAAGKSALLYSAAVGGGAPVLETVEEARGQGTVQRVEAVLNGTVNFILDRLHRGVSFDAALAEARARGFAEEDCSNDLSGADAAAKLRLIAAAAFDVDPGAVEVEAEALDPKRIALIRASGRRWIQHSQIDGKSARVCLRAVEEVDPFLLLPEEWNGAIVVNADGAIFQCTGRGAGGAPTSEAILSDLYAIARQC